MPARSDSLARWERIGFVLIAGCLGLVQFSLLVAQGLLLTLAVFVWLAVVVRERRRPEVPAFFLPLAVYAALTLISSAVSLNPVKSFWDSRQLLMWLVVPIVMRFARGERANEAVNVIIALGAAGAVIGIVEFAMLGYDNLNKRPEGLLSHYMTYSGGLMLVTCAAAARLIFQPQLRVWPAIAVPALLVALVVTYARNAWIGVLAAMTCLLGLRRARLVWIVPALVVVFFALAPAALRSRAFSIFDRHDPTNRDRFVMLAIGADIIREHPWFGVGPEMIQPVYPQYRARHPDAVNPINPHLHNVPVQIAAERGVPALLAWIWFIAVAARDLFRQLRRGPARALAGAGAGAVVAMIAAGMFEYNFGDSEFLILFLGLITLPFAAARPQA